MWREDFSLVLPLPQALNELAGGMLGSAVGSTLPLSSSTIPQLAPLWLAFYWIWRVSQVQWGILLHSRATGPT